MTALDAGPIVALPGLVSFWDFQESPGRPRVAQGRQRSVLVEAAGPVPVADEGLFGPRSLRLGGGQFLHIPRPDLGALNIHGPRAQVSVVAWLKRHANTSGGGCEAVAGVWNEHARRQYCLFLNLQIWDSAEQVGAHISGIGGATPGYPYCMDAAIGATPVPLDHWHCCAITYDGQFARAYLDGRLDARPGRNPYPYDLGIFDGGAEGGDFTVGAVARPDRIADDFRPIGHVIANRFHGLLAALAVFDRALTDDELRNLPQPPPPRN